MSAVLDDLRSRIRESADGTGALEALRARILTLTMPTRALERLLELAEELTRAADRPLDIRQSEVVVFAAEHGVAEEGVSAYPAEVTRQMILNFCGGGAAINQLCASAGAGLKVVNVATGGEYPGDSGLVDAPVAASSRNLRSEPALDRAAMFAAIELGASVVSGDVFAAGEMGIGNTTPSACLTVALTNVTVEAATGRGTGVDDEALEIKRRVVAEALDRSGPPADPLELLVELGGYEHAAIVGAVLECAARRIPFILDGVIATSAAAVAAAIEPRCREVMIASHCGAEPAHRILLDHLGKKPYLEWGLRLGEGSGAALLLPLCRAAMATVNGMSTFEDAGVSDKD